MALACGLRTGEALALQWADIDFEARTMHVRHTLQRVRRRNRRVQGDGEGLVLQPTKTRASKQKLPIPDVVVRALRAHRARQLEERLAAGTRWAFERRPARSVDASTWRPRSSRRSCPRRRSHDAVRGMTSV